MRLFREKQRTVRAVQFGRGQAATRVICTCNASTGPHIHRLGEARGSAIAVADGDWIVADRNERSFRVMSDEQFKDRYEAGEDV